MSTTILPLSMIFVHTSKFQGHLVAAAQLKLDCLTLKSISTYCRKPTAMQVENGLIRLATRMAQWRKTN